MKLHNSGVLWFSGLTCGWALSDAVSAAHIYNPSSWTIVATEAVMGFIAAALAFHPITGGGSSHAG